MTGIFLRLNYVHRSFKVSNGTTVHLVKLPAGGKWSCRIVYDNDLLNIDTPAYGRFVGRTPFEKPVRTLPELVDAEGESLKGAVAVNGNNLYWHSQDFVVINGQLITRRNTVIDSSENVCLVQRIDGTLDIDTLSIRKNQLESRDINQAVFGFRLVEAGDLSFWRHLEQFRFDFRKVFVMPKLSNWKPIDTPAELPKEFSQEDFDLDLARQAFLGQSVWLDFNRVDSPQDLTEGMKNAGYADFKQEGMRVLARLKESEGPVNAVGTDRELNLFLMIANGRLADQPGLTLRQAAQLFIDHGVERAICLDGGGDTTFFLDGELKNIPPNEGGKLRGIPSAVLFKRTV